MMAESQKQIEGKKDVHAAWLNTLVILLGWIPNDGMSTSRVATSAVRETNRVLRMILKMIH